MLPNGTTIQLYDIKLAFKDVVDALGFIPAHELPISERKYRMISKTTRTVTTYDSKGNLQTTQKVVEVLEILEDQKRRKTDHHPEFLKSDEPMGVEEK
jgi:hypothetical protein